MQNAVLANALNGIVATASSPWECGHAKGPCSSDRNYIQIGSQWTDPSNCQPTSADPSANLLDNVWAVSSVIGIELPVTDTWVYLNPTNSNAPGGQETSGHHWICP
jgi:hypothetical protein